MKETMHTPTHKPPRIGDEISYRNVPVGQVRRIEGNLCWYGDGDGLFIWAFKDGLNALHDWPGKLGPIAFCPGVLSRAQ